MVHRSLAVALLCAPGVASAQSVFGTNGTSCGYSTLQAAVNAAPTGGTVWVAAGTRLVTSTVVVDHSITIAGSNSSCQSGTTGRPIVHQVVPAACSRRRRPLPA